MSALPQPCNSPRVRSTERFTRPISGHRNLHSDRHRPVAPSVSPRSDRHRSVAPSYNSIPRRYPSPRISATERWRSVLFPLPPPCSLLPALHSYDRPTRLLRPNSSFHRKTEAFPRFSSSPHSRPTFRGFAGYDYDAPLTAPADNSAPSLLLSRIHTYDASPAPLPETLSPRPGTRHSPCRVWPSRDPIGEQGCVCLLSFMQNNSINDVCSVPPKVGQV